MCSALRPWGLLELTLTPAPAAVHTGSRGGREEEIA